jgi:hypothetical protein
MAAPTQMFTHALDHLKGWPSPSAVDFVAKLSANVTVPDSAYGGRVVHLNNSKEFELGAKVTQMPIFLIQGSNEFDVANPGDGASSPHGWTAIAPAGWMSGLVAIGAYELETTEFKTDDTYNPNDILHSPTEDQVSTKTDAGKLFRVKNWSGGGGGAFTVGTDLICGVVSRGKKLNHHRVSVLSFWPVYIPGTA